MNVTSLLLQQQQPHGHVAARHRGRLRAATA
jgi:hypothetical protein